MRSVSDPVYRMRGSRACHDTYDAAGNLPATAGGYDRARRNYDQALHVRLDTLGAAHPTTLDTLTRLGMLCQAQGDIAAARSSLHRAHAGYQQAFGPDHPIVHDLAERMTSVS